MSIDMGYKFDPRIVELALRNQPTSTMVIPKNKSAVSLKKLIRDNNITLPEIEIDFCK